MTGTIVGLVVERRVGAIRTKSGSTYLFHASAVQGREFDLLTVGQEVSFDLEHGPRKRDVVWVQRELIPSKNSNKTEAIMHLRYMGFEQGRSVRVYKFDGVVHGETTEHFVVVADLTLFAKHHVAIQEGPGLCLQKLSASLPGSPQPSQELNGDDLAAFAATRAAAARHAGPRKWVRPRKPGVTTAAAATAATAGEE